MRLDCRTQQRRHSLLETMGSLPVERGLGRRTHRGQDADLDASALQSNASHEILAYPKDFAGLPARGVTDGCNEFGGAQRGHRHVRRVGQDGRSP